MQKNLVILGMTMLASTAMASTTICTEIKTSRQNKIEVVINELANITSQVPYGKKFDAVYSVHVIVNEVEKKQKNKIKEFTAIAKTADVEYQISSVQKNGFSFWRYLDEENQDGVELTSADGSKQTFQLNCREK